MQKRTRRVLFWFAAVVFVVASWAAILYAQGYAYDFSTRTFVRTGAIAATVNTNASLYIDTIRVGDTSFLGNRVGKEGVLPGYYNIQITRDQHSVWKKNVVVQEGQLTDFPNVLILPIDPDSLSSLRREASSSMQEPNVLRGSPIKKMRVESGDPALYLVDTALYDARTSSASMLSDRVLGFTITRDKSRVVWWTRNEVWVMWFRNTDQQPYRIEDEQQSITRFSSPIQGVAWFRDNEHLVVDLGNASYRILELDTRGGVNVIKL